MEIKEINKKMDSIESTTKIVPQFRINSNGNWRSFGGVYFSSLEKAKKWIKSEPPENTRIVKETTIIQILVPQSNTSPVEK